MNYKKIHDSIILRAISRKLDSYTEKHHIIPKCLGGDNSKNNLVKLTAKEHYVIHRLLVRIYPENYKLVFAFWRMCNCNRYITSPRIYESTKVELAIAMSKSMKGIKPKNYENLRDKWKRPILEFLNGEFVREFDSTKAAAEFHNVDKRYIFNILKGLSKKPRLFPGRMWKYKSEKK